jgi:chemosensory pili system protein ChpA (sensor histidine kinase/response regulator)
MDISTSADAPAGDDLSALAWVHGELKRSLDNAHKALRRHLKEAEALADSDVDTVDPSVLRGARTQIHQGVGALELVGKPTVANVLRASEAAVQRMIARPAIVDAAAVEAVERVSFAVLDFLARQLAGKPVSPVMLFPQYRAALQLAAADRVHPADLWPFDFQWHALAPEPGLAARASDDAARSEMEALVLALMRGTDARVLAMTSDFCAALAGGESGTAATLWRLAAAVFQAQAQGLLAADVYSKRIASRLLAQLRMNVRGQREPSDRLAHDLLFFCAHAAPPSKVKPAPRLEAVRRVWRLDQHATVDYETPRLGRFDPALITLARKRVAAAKDSWSAVAGGETHRASGMAEQFALVGDSLGRLFAGGDVLAQSLQAAVGRTVASGQAPAPALAMEVATAMLYVDASIEDGELDHPDVAERMQRLARRIDDVRIGAAPQPLESWMEELYRRVSDRQTMGSVVQELRATLSEIEKQIDQYFRNPADRQQLFPVPGQLGAMRGVLSVLGMDEASAAVLRMRDDIDALAQTEVDPQRAIATGTFDRVADNLGALSFLIDMLSVQPALAKSLFRFDAASGSLHAVMGQSERISAFAGLDTAPPSPVEATLPLMDQARAIGAAALERAVPDSEMQRRLEGLAQQALAAEQPALARTANAAAAALRGADGERERAGVRSDLAQALSGFAPLAPEPAPPPAPLPPKTTPAPAAAGGTGLEDDAEMREIFIEEAREVVAEARAALERLADTPESGADMTAVRRAFHTLKGSSRMVGLKDFGEAGWSCEQLYNARLAQAPRLDGPLRQFTTEALDYMADWVEAIAAGRDAGHRSAAVARAADALRLEGLRVPIEPAQAAPAAPGAAEVRPVTSPLPVVVEVPAAPLPEPVPVPAVAERPLLPETLEPVTEAGAFAATTPVPFDPPQPVQAPAAGFDFELDLTESASPLSLRVPDLPSAADLELKLPEPATPPVPVPPEVDFALDLRGLDGEAEPAPPPPPEAPAAEPVSLEALLRDLPPPSAPAAPPSESVALDLDLPALPAVPPAAAAPAPAAPVPAADDDQVKVIGPLRISIPLFNIYLNEADELSRRLATELAEWSVDPLRHPVPEGSIALAHSLAGSSATVGYADLSGLARSLEHALERSLAVGHGREGEAELFGEAADEIRRLLHQFAAGFLRPVPEALAARLADHERWPAEGEGASEAAVAAAAEVAEVDGADLDLGLPELRPESEAEPEREREPEPPPTRRVELPGPVVSTVSVSDFAPLADLGDTPAPQARADAFDDDQDIDAVDAVDPELFPIFDEEAQELLPQLQAQLRAWHDRPADRDAATGCMRTLHTFKGGARLAGAMRLGEMAHRLETAIEHLLARDGAAAAELDPLLSRVDAMALAFEALRRAPPPAPVADITLPLDLDAASEQPPAPPLAAAAETPVDATQPIEPAALAAAAPAAPRVALPQPIDWARFAFGPDAAPEPAAERAASGVAAVRVRASLLDRLVNQAGEVSITRERIAADTKALQVQLQELTESLDRLRRQLRDIELQAETQIATRMENARAAGQSFDPLEMDRFTRFQELTRFMAESVNDVATTQRSLQRTLQSTEDELAAHARITRELQDDLLRTRMVEFESMADRLYRTVRQAAKETGKQVRLDIVGGAIEIDRGVLERMVGPFEHLLRNSVVHGIEAPALREKAGKEPSGRIAVQLAQSGNEVAIEFADDGGGFDYERIRRRGIERGLVAPDARPGDAELAQLLFTPGFSTADSVTELAGRGVGLDVVRAEVNAMGGRIETGSAPGQGTRFRLLLPLTTAVTQIVMLRCGTLQVAVPSTLVEVVRRVNGADLGRAYDSGAFEHAGEAVPFYWLAALLQASARGDVAARSNTVVVIRSAAQRVAVHVDEVVGNQEVVVKNVGPQLARLPGLAGVTLLPSGAVALIYNPVALATLYGDGARERMRAGAAGGVGLATQPAQPVPAQAAAEAPRAPLVLVVDDSLTVRRVTQRLLVREGYRVVTAKDGLDALEKLAEERPVVLLSDIEMPRMDGFDLVRNVRADERLADLPVVMITSRIAQKHRDYAAELGVDHYLGKPYSEEELLALVARYAGADIAT